MVLARAPEQEPEPELEPVVPVLVGLLELVVQLGPVVPVPVLVVQALLLAVLVARRALAAIRHAIHARGRTAGARRKTSRPRPSGRLVEPGEQGCARPREAWRQHS